MDIVVTTPRPDAEAAAAEAQACVRAGGGEYFRRLPSKPVELRVGDHVWYVQEGYLRGFCLVIGLVDRVTSQWCCTTGRRWPKGFYVYMDAATWQWIRPVPMRGFQGYRYFTDGVARRYGIDPKKLQIVGGWKDPMPEVADE